jgi:hypothetical protein
LAAPADPKADTRVVERAIAGAMPRSVKQSRIDRIRRTIVRNLRRNHRSAAVSTRHRCNNPTEGLAARQAMR